MEATVFMTYQNVRKFLLLLCVGMVVVLAPVNAVYANWEQTGGPTASVLCLCVSDSNLFAGTNGSGVFCSTKNGLGWKAVNNGLPANSIVQSLCVSGGSIFAGTNGSGVFCSSDNGANWTAVNKGLPANTAVGSVVVCGVNIFIVNNQGRLFCSDNSGATWTAANNCPSPIRSLAADGNNLFAATEGNGIIFSTNRGTSWKPVNSNLPANTSVRSLAASGTTLFAGTEGHGVFILTYDGTNWKVVKSEIATATVLSLAASRGLVFAGTNPGVSLSTDNGTTWKSINDSLLFTDALSLAVNGNYLFVAASGKGVARRTLKDMVTITQLNFKHLYECPNNYYTFTWTDVTNAVWYDLYGNDVLFLHTRNSSDASRLSSEAVVDTIGKGLDKSLKWGEMLSFYMVARSDSNRTLAISNTITIPFELAVGAQTKRAIQKGSGSCISGLFIDCSSIRGTVQVSLYSLNGEKVWEQKGMGVKTKVPAHLSRGAYTLVVNRPSVMTSRIIVKE